MIISIDNKYNAHAARFLLSTLNLVLKTLSRFGLESLKKIKVMDKKFSTTFSVNPIMLASSLLHFASEACNDRQCTVFTAFVYKEPQKIKRIEPKPYTKPN